MAGPLILIPIGIAIRAAIMRLLQVIIARLAAMTIKSLLLLLKRFAVMSVATEATVVSWSDDVNAATDGEFKEWFDTIKYPYYVSVATILNHHFRTDIFKADDIGQEGGIDRAACQLIDLETGVTLRTLKDKAMLRDDLEDYALRRIKGYTGYELHSLHDVEIMKKDFATIAGGEIARRVGIPLTNILDMDTTKSELLDWAQDQVMMRISDVVSDAVAATMQKGGKTLLAQIQEKLGKKVSGKSLLMGLNDAIVGRYMVRWEAFNNISKEDRRKLQNRMAQRKFRDRGNPESEIYDGRKGGRMEYIPVGFDSQLNPPNNPGVMEKVGTKARSIYEKAKDKLTGKKTPETTAQTTTGYATDNQPVIAPPGMKPPQPPNPDPTQAQTP
jgi:hypothetical protein